MVGKGDRSEGRERGKETRRREAKTSSTFKGQTARGQIAGHGRRASGTDRGRAGETDTPWG